MYTEYIEEEDKEERDGKPADTDYVVSRLKFINNLKDKANKYILCGRAIAVCT